MKKKKQHRFQQKLDHREPGYDISEYAQEHLVTPSYGPLVTSDMYAELDALEFFSPKKLDKFRTRLKKSMAKYPSDLAKIEEGLASYVNSASLTTRPLAILAASLLCNFDNILLENYENTSEIDRQFLNISYFQSNDWIAGYQLQPADFIYPDALSLYVKRANELTIAAMKEWFAYALKKDGNAALASSYEQMFVHKGVNHPGYYQQLQYKPDLLSAYTAIDNAPFFESELLSSYTLSAHVANMFVSGTISKKGQRRLKVEGHPEMIEGRILSSWIVSASFLDGQYEILCLPNRYTLTTQCGYASDLVAGFSLERKLT